MSVRARLLALQPTEELRRKAVKSSRRGYGKVGGFRLATNEVYEYNTRTNQETMRKLLPQISVRKT